MKALPLLAASGVKVAVKTAGSAVSISPLIKPPTAVMASALKPTGTSEKTKLIVAIWPAIKTVVSLVMSRVGGRVS